MPGGRPTKPLSLVQGHRTKTEKAVREKAEASLLTGTKMKESPEVKADPIAHKEFKRIQRLLRSIGKDDDLSGNIINTHCLLHAECKEFEQMKDRLYSELKDLSEAYQNGKIDFLEYMNQKGQLQDRLFTCDKKIMEKRKMILDISKENIMTIQSALRSIPKKTEKKEPSKMAAMLEKRQAR
jgi:phage terminase small subunit